MYEKEGRKRSNETQTIMTGPPTISDDLTWKYDDHDHTEQDCCCCMEEEEKEGDSAAASSSCLVVAMEGGVVVVFDAAGNARSFQAATTSPTSSSVVVAVDAEAKELCFDHPYNNLPCFTAQGLHGIPEEPCVICDVETPHLHAHVKDETICNHSNHHHHHNEENENAMDWKERLKLLATQVLHPIHPENNYNNNNHEEVISLLLPEEQQEHQATEATSTIAEKKRFFKRRCKKHCTSRRVVHTQIRHNGTHTDRLVHHRKLNVLTLEHEVEPTGHVELHATFHSSTKNNKNNKPQRRILSNSTNSNNNIVVQFYQPTKPFQVHDYWNHLFVVEEQQQGPKTTTTTSFYCAAAATTAFNIDSLIQPMPGVYSIRHESETPIVHIEHDPSQISDKVLCMLLNDEDFQATILTTTNNNVPTTTTSSSSIPTTTTTTTTVFHCKGMCCKSEVPLIDDLLKPVNGVQTVTYDVPARTVTVEHISSKVSPEIILKLLNDDEFDATIHSAGGVKEEEKTLSTVSTTAIITTIFHCKGMCCQSEIPLIDNLLKPVNGIQMITYDVPARTVTVDHFSSKVSAEKILKLLNDDDFDATIVSMLSTNNNMTATPTLTTTFHCKGMCCKSEVPLIDELLKPIDGVQSITYDVPARTVTVEHSPSKVDAETILKLLNDDNFDATFVSMLSTNNSMTATPMLTTTFHCKGMCCQSEVPLIDELLKPIDGVQSIVYDVPARTVTVEHFPSKVDAETILKLLNEDDFDATFVSMSTTNMTAPPTLTTFHCKGMCCKSEVPLIDELLKPIDGVLSITYDVPARTVTVEHFPSKVDAETILKLLEKNDFDPTILVNLLSTTATTTTTPMITIFHCSGMCCKSEVPLIDDLLKPIDGVQSIAYDVPARTVSVEHVPSKVSPETILKLLNDDDFGATIVSMLSATNMTAPPTLLTTFHCKGMCCKSEVPLIDDLLKPIDGIQSIAYDVPARTVTVEHFPAKVSAQVILKLLNDDDFDATIIPLLSKDVPASVCLRNPSAVVTTPLNARDMLPGPANNNNETSLMARTILYVDHICCASEIPAIRSIVEPLAGVSKVSVVVATKLVYVDHDCRIVSANQISDALNRERFGADVRLDGEQAAAAAAGNTLFCTSSFAFQSAEVSTEELEILFSTTFDKTQVQSFSVDPATQMILVVHNSQTLPAEGIVAALSKSPTTRVILILDGTDSVQIDYEALVGSSAGNKDDTDGKKERNVAYPRPTVIVSGVLWLISMLSLIGGNWDYLKYVGLASVSFGLPPIAMKAFYQIKRLQLDANCLMFFASIGALALGDFTEAAAVVFLFALSEWLEVRATSRARQALSAIVNLKPEKANLVHHETGELLLVPASAVPVGALIAVKTGDKIPCDGVVVEGQSTVDESSLTGESRPISKSVKDEVSGGTVNSGVSQLMVRTTASAENSAVARLIRLVEEAQANRSETEKMVDEFAKFYTPFIIISALLMCTIPWAFGDDVGRHWTEQGKKKPVYSKKGPLENIQGLVLCVAESNHCFLPSDRLGSHRSGLSLRSDYIDSGDIRGWNRSNSAKWCSYQRRCIP